MCQLQIKICSKLLERVPLKRQPKSLKHFAGATILKPFRVYDHTPQCKHKEIDKLQGYLPNDLVAFLQGQ
jgi:hypothetical protein